MIADYLRNCSLGISGVEIPNTRALRELYVLGDKNSFTESKEIAHRVSMNYQFPLKYAQYLRLDDEYVIYDKIDEYPEETKNTFNKFIQYLSYNNSATKVEKVKEKNLKNLCTERVGKIEIYFRKNNEKKTENFSINIFNNIFSRYTPIYSFYFLQYFCKLFEYNYLDGEQVKIETALFIIDRSMWLEATYNCYYSVKEDEDEILENTNVLIQYKSGAANTYEKKFKFIYAGYEKPEDYTHQCLYGF